MIELSYIPQKPFPEFKWKWANLACTEGINEPVVLLGVLSRMRKIEGKSFSSQEFAEEMQELQQDLDSANINVEVGRRTGDRNIMRNSKQYWTATKLIKPTQGIIELTDFGRKVADKEYSQTEFAAITIQTHQLPNPAIQSKAECDKWAAHGICIYPLKLILEICVALHSCGLEHYITTEELVKVIIPLSSANAQTEDYVNFISAYRKGLLNISLWDNYIPEANDLRIAREFLLFLTNYGYLQKVEQTSRLTEQYFLNMDIYDEIVAMLHQTSAYDVNITAEIDRKQIKTNKNRRPNQAKFRKDLLTVCERCVITSVAMPEVLEAAHIVPVKYNGEDTVSNGFAMRTDIHDLYDLDYLRISVDGDVILSERTRLNYGYTIPPKIVIPDYVNKEFIKWRWDNYHGI